MIPSETALVSSMGQEGKAMTGNDEMCVLYLRPGDSATVRGGFDSLAAQ
jgi:hypothetical protein